MFLSQNEETKKDMPYEILIVDDEPYICDSIAGVLQDEGYKTRQVSNGQQALDAVLECLPSLIVLDIWLGDPQLDGIKVLEILRSQYISLPIIMMSAHGSLETAIAATKLGAYDFVEKPFKANKLILLIKRALKTFQLLRENTNLKLRQSQNTDDIVGKSQKIEQLRLLLEKVAPTNSRIFITGPKGSGKKFLSVKLHDLSLRSKEPFIRVNCFDINKNNFDKFLFGVDCHKNKRPYIGFLEEANRGTIFFDEVLGLPINTQRKLLKALHAQSFYRLGNDRKKVCINVRVISSTSYDIKNAILSGTFREDLYYRLNVVHLKSLSLQERQEDINSLIVYFIKKFSQDYGCKKLRISPEALYIMQQYSWPGNIRQLRNFVEWMLIMYSKKNKEQVITIGMLPPEFLNNSGAKFLDSSAVNDSILELSLKEARINFEKNYLKAQVQRFSGNISKTASFIGMERSALHRKLCSLKVNHKKYK